MNKSIYGFILITVYIIRFRFNQNKILSFIAMIKILNTCIWYYLVSTNTITKQTIYVVILHHLIYLL